MPFVKKTLKFMYQPHLWQPNEAKNHSPIDTAGKYYNP